MVYSELPTLSSLSSWASQKSLSHLSRWNLSSYDSSIVSLPLSPRSRGPGRDRVRVGAPWPHYTHYPPRESGSQRKERGEREWVRGGRSVNTVECGEGVRPGCGRLRPCRRHLGHTRGAHPGLSTFQWRRGQVSAWVTHVAITGPGRPGICHESENWSGPGPCPDTCPAYSVKCLISS